MHFPQGLRMLQNDSKMEAELRFTLLQTTNTADQTCA